MPINYDEVFVFSDEFPFRKIGGFDRYKILDSTDGYSYYSFKVFKSSFTSNSNLYLIHNVNEFTPEHVARLNNNYNYRDYFLDEGFVHLELQHYVNKTSYGVKFLLKIFGQKVMILL